MDRTTLRQVLLEQLAQVTGENRTGLEDDLSLRDGLGLDSVDLVFLVVNIQGIIGIELKSDELEKTEKAGDLLDLIQCKLAALRPAA